MKATLAEPARRTLCARIDTVYGSTYAMTDHPVDLSIGLNLYRSTAGYEFTGFSSPDGFAVASIDVTGILQVLGIAREKALGGHLDGAVCWIFATDWANPVEDEEPIVCGIFGRLTVRDDRFEISGSSLAEAIGETVGRTYGAQCPKVFGGQEYAGCKLDLTPYTATGSVGSVIDASSVYDSARTEAAGTWAFGTIEFTSGPLAGYGVYEVRAFSSGVVTIHDQWPVLPQVGDDYQIIMGCQKRLDDCIAYGNVVNFGGFPWIPVSSVYAARGIPPANSG